MKRVFRKPVHALLALVLFVFAGSASAQDVLNLASVRELALSSSLSLRKAELACETALLASKAQEYQRLPSLGASAGAALDYLSDKGLSDAFNASAKLSVSQSVFDGGRLAALSESSSLELRAAAEAARAVRVGVLGQADSAYYALLKTSANVASASSDLEAANLRLGIARAKVDSGVIAASDYLQAVSEAASRETALTKARKSESSARSRLASMAGLSGSFVLESVEFSQYDGLLSRIAALDDQAEDGLAAAYVAMAESGNPSLAGYDLAARKAAIGVDVAKSAYLPTITAGLSQGLSYRAADGLSLGSGSVSLTGSMSLDFWNTANGVAKAMAAAESTALEGAQGGLGLRLNIEVGVNDLLSAARSIGSSAKALEYSESNYRNVLERFRLSASSASDLSAAEALVSTARTGLIGARYDFLSALCDLRVLVGLETDDRIESAIP